ncbi:MAG: polymerase gamma/tau subunit [Actinomycetota bacterium]|jgi:DNA polymerase-3 subunit gamma/tau
MADSGEYQALYRRYRPQRFSELRGQDHITLALKNAVINDRVGHAYLFSGPRGTGKTTTARILAKVLNCERPIDGEPCCECPSCVSVQQGNSFDVIELDAASNNSVDEMRDLIQRAGLGTPGRFKVYILDEVHMLSKGASAALLKTLEEPPPHVVFVLATTDPEKVQDTIRSRTQHLQFHLLPVDDLAAHVRWVAADAGITLDEVGVDFVLKKGGGSARDTLSALELLAATGKVVDETTPVDEFVAALIDYDAGSLLATMARTIHFGRDPRAIVEDLVRHLRDCFLTQMAPELVQSQEHRAKEIAEQARQLGTARIVKIMETLGTAMLDMRGAPDQRVVLEVALIRLVHRQLETGIDALLGRVERLEKELAERASSLPPAPVNPSTGRAVIGGRAPRDPSGPANRPPSTPNKPAEAPSSAPAVASGSLDTLVARWADDVLGRLVGMRRAVAQMAKPEVDGSRVVLTVPNEHAGRRVNDYLTDITKTIHEAVGPCTVVIEVRPESPAEASSKKSKIRDEEEIDIEEVKKLPTATAKSAEEELLEAFPDAKFVDGNS